MVVCVSQYLYAGKLRRSNDASGVRDALVNDCGYPPDRVTVLEEGEATRDNILRALERIADMASAPDARAFIYFSGHGGQGPDGQSYILPVDARKGEYDQTAISGRELSRLLDRCSGELTVVLDCCRAAAMATVETSSNAEPAELAAFTDALRGVIRSRNQGEKRSTRRVLLAASRAQGRAFMSPEAPYSIFTGHMLDCLRGAEAELTHGANVTIQQLFAYVEKRVRRDSGSAQQPLFIAETESFYDVTDYRRPITNPDNFTKDVFVSYHRDDDELDDWVQNILYPELRHHDLSIWDYDDLAHRKLDVSVAIAKSRYTVVLLTPEYLAHDIEEFTAVMAVLQAVETRSPRFVPVMRKQCTPQLEIRTFVTVNMTPGQEMRYRRNMNRLIARLKKRLDEL